MQEWLSQAYKLIAQGQIEECISLLEQTLQCIPSTPYHAIMGRDLLAMTDVTSYFLQVVYELCEELPVAAIYVEMNNFYINPDRWYIQGFGYNTLQEDLNLAWLCSWKYVTDFCLVIKGVEDLQLAYRDFSRGQNHSPEIHAAADLTDYLIVLRLQQLIRAAHQDAITQNPALKQIPILSTAHDIDLIYLSR